MLRFAFWTGLGVYGRTTFLVQEGCLVTRNFPFASHNRRVPVADIRGIQVNAEVNEEGAVTHYSLLLAQRSGTDRLIDLKASPTDPGLAPARLST